MMNNKSFKLLAHFIIYGQSWSLKGLQIAFAHVSSNHENFSNMTGALKTRNACAVNAISQTCHQKKCPIFFPWGYVLSSNFSPDDETAKKNSSEKKGSIIVAKLHFLCGFSVSKQTKSAQSYSHKLYEFYCAVTIKGIGNHFMLVRLVKRI